MRLPWLLQQMGLAAREAAPLLEYRFRQEGRTAFLVALANIAPEKAVPLLRRATVTIRKEVVRLLAGSDNLQPASADLFAELLDDRGVALDAAMALVRLDPSKA